MRGLIRKSSSRIRWLVGTATDLTLDESDPLCISSVTVRCPDKSEQKIATSVDIGKFYLFYRVYAFINVSRLYGADPSWFQMAQASRHEGIWNGSEEILVDHQRTAECIREEYDALSPFDAFRFTVPENLRAKIPIPGGFADACSLYTSVPIPGEEVLYAMVHKLEGHRRKSTYFMYLSP